MTVEFLEFVDVAFNSFFLLKKKNLQHQQQAKSARLSTMFVVLVKVYIECHGVRVQLVT